MLATFKTTCNLRNDFLTCDVKFEITFEHANKLEFKNSPKKNFAHPNCQLKKNTFNVRSNALN